MQKLLLFVFIAIIIYMYFQESQTDINKQLENFRSSRRSRRFSRSPRNFRRNLRSYRWGRRRWGPRRWRRVRWGTVPHHLYGPYYDLAYNHWLRYWKQYDLPYRTWYYKYFIHTPTYYVPNIQLPSNIDYYADYTEPLDTPIKNDLTNATNTTNTTNTVNVETPSVETPSKNQSDKTMTTDIFNYNNPMVKFSAFTLLVIIVILAFHMSSYYWRKN